MDVMVEKKMCMDNPCLKECEKPEIGIKLKRFLQCKTALSL